MTQPTLLFPLPQLSLPVSPLWELVSRFSLDSAVHVKVFCVWLLNSFFFCFLSRISLFWSQTSNFFFSLISLFWLQFSSSFMESDGTTIWMEFFIRPMNTRVSCFPLDDKQNDFLFCLTAKVVRTREMLLEGCFHNFHYYNMDPGNLHRGWRWRLWMPICFVLVCSQIEFITVSSREVEFTCEWLPKFCTFCGIFSDHAWHFGLRIALPVFLIHQIDNISVQGGFKGGSLDEAGSPSSSFNSSVQFYNLLTFVVKFWRWRSSYIAKICRDKRKWFCDGYLTYMPSPSFETKLLIRFLALVNPILVTGF